MFNPTSISKGRGPKKNTYFLWSFAKPGGGGSARGVKKPYCFFEKQFFQRACRIILGPPKHVLHLVWSPFVIYTAIRTALKEAWEARILGKRRSESKNKKIEFWNGTKCKICFTYLWSYFREKKMGANFHIRNKTIRGDHKKYSLFLLFFRNPSTTWRIT